ncbi:MAG: ADP-ribose pyrophosphatase YjhB (NUDIX family) [Gammaproteobacteria bacterium]|jgi:ADP-ribose pyrophosphatase YjhB (NUDIX family)
MLYCSECSAEVELKIPDGDNRQRYVCIKCNSIHYQNPKIVAGCIPVWDDQVLLCKRAIEPQYGFWTLPAGFMENGESTLQAAIRETMEEANARVKILDIYMIINLPHVNQVYMMYRSRMIDKNYASGSESLEVDLYKEEDIPWNLLAFPVIRETLKYYYMDRKQGEFRIRTGEILREAGSYDFNLHT